MAASRRGYCCAASFPVPMFNKCLTKTHFPWFGWIRSRVVAHPLPCHGQSYEWRRRKLAPVCTGLAFLTPKPLYGNGIPDGALTKKARCLSTASFLLTRDSVGIRTQDPQLRRLLLYPAELPNHPAYSAGKKDAPANRTANIGIFYYLAMLFLRKVSFGRKIAIIFAGNAEF